MGLSRFSSVMTRAVEAVLATAAALRYVRDTQGDLPWWALDRVQDGLAEAKVSCIEALVEGQRQPASSETFMASLGGPATLGDFQSKIAACEAAAAAWNASLGQLLASLTATEVIALVRRGQGNMGTSHIERVSYLAQDRADTLRQSAQLAALIAAFEAVGA